jgi:dTDP-4-dehydrorhamnose reductase
MIDGTITIVGAGSRLAYALIPALLQETDARLHLVSSAPTVHGGDRILTTVLDVTDKAALKSAVMAAMPRVIINCAAFTNVDACETDRQKAWAINVTLPETLTRLARILEAHIVHVSTDYVFDGTKGPYVESALPQPINYYGKSKLAGENVCLSGNTSATIVRTTVLYGFNPYRPDFVRWVLDALESKTPIRVVNDQYSNPTLVDDLADAITRIVLRRRTGLYHVGGADYLDRYTFAVRIAEFFKADPSVITPVSTDELKQAARRPLRGGLVSLKAETDLGMTMSSIAAGLSTIRHRMFAAPKDQAFQ